MEKVWKKKMHNQPREPQPYEDWQAKLIQEFGWTSQGMDWGWDQGIKSHHTDVSRNLATVVVRGVLPGLRRGTGLFPSDPKSYFQMRASFFFISFGNQGPRVWRKGVEAHSPSCLKSSVKFPQSVIDLGCIIICCCWSIVFFENQRHCTHLPSNYEALHASFGWPAF